MSERGFLEKTIGIAAVSYQRLDFCEQLAVFAARLANKGIALGRAFFQRKRENLIYLFPSFLHCHHRAANSDTTLSVP
jgi:hypothetical protein